MTIQDWREFTAEPADELREKVLAEFAKPELPAPVDLFRICECYMVRVFDLHAEKIGDLNHAEYVKRLEIMVDTIPRQAFSDLTGPFQLAVQRAMSAFVFHNGKPKRTVADFEPYLRIVEPPDVFFTYALRSRRDYWAAWRLNRSESSPRPRTKEHVAQPKLERLIPEESVKERAGRRQKVIDPLLDKAKIKSINRWETEAEVANKAGRQYYDGFTVVPTEETLRKLAKPLGVDYTDLPL